MEGCRAFWGRSLEPAPSHEDAEQVGAAPDQCAQSAANPLSNDDRDLVGMLRIIRGGDAAGNDG